jgi:AbrB family looped-hinge helix DNA binding protein
VQNILEIMTVYCTLDDAGRIVIPKKMREALHLEPGDTLEVERAGEALVLRPVAGWMPLTKEHGVWVLHTGQPLPASVTDKIMRKRH